MKPFKIALSTSSPKFLKHPWAQLKLCGAGLCVRVGGGGVKTLNLLKFYPPLHFCKQEGAVKILATPPHNGKKSEQ